MIRVALADDSALVRAGFGVLLDAEADVNDEIAAELFISVATARTQVSRAMTKLHKRDRSQLVVAAYESGLVTPGQRE